MHAESRARLIAFHLPQYHPNPDNDQWWGRGFTDWLTVVRARPLFPGHHQPHLPADLGFYDLRLGEARDAQAELARAHGIHGFCYYHYWFEGRRLLGRPLDELLASGRPDFPFCLSWANENWTSVWVGRKHEVLIEQRYSARDDVAHIEWLIPVLHDPRYIRVDGRPLLLIHDGWALPEPAVTAERWRKRAEQAGLPGLYLCSGLLGRYSGDVGPPPGFDALVEYPPGDLASLPRLGSALGRALARLGLRRNAPYARHKIRPYTALIERSLRRPEPPFKLFPGVAPGFDNSPRRPSGGNVFVGSTPELYGRWLRAALSLATQRFEGEERLVFINAWNEWAEGNHLEPDERWGLAYLEQTLAATRGDGTPREIGTAPARGEEQSFAERFDLARAR